MAKRITYEIVESSQIVGVRFATCPTEASFEAVMAIVEKEAVPDSILITGEFDPVHPVAPHNIVSGEYVSVNNALYLATENVPNGEPLIEGQNVVVTSVEKQLFELTKGE